MLDGNALDEEANPDMTWVADKQLLPESRTPLIG
jgi:hypothetical protein